MEIVIEYVFLQNFFIDLMILKATEKILHNKGKHFVVLSIIAAAFAVIMPLFYLQTVFELILKLFFAAFIVSLTFNYKKLTTFLKIYLVFMFVTFLFGGVNYFFVQAFGNLNSLIVLGIVTSTYFLFNWVYRYVNIRKNIEKFCYDVVLKKDENLIKCKGFLDTGNLAFDPLTHRPVCIIGLKLFEELFCDISFKDILLGKIDLSKLKLGHYITLGTVEGQGKMLTFQIDGLKIDGKDEIEKPMLGLSLKNYAAYDMILHNSFAGV